MDEKIERLKALGCDTDTALKRMLDDEEFYLECLHETLDNSNFEKLNEALLQHDIERAFDCAHALKSLLGNVGLTPMYKKDIEIVETLRRSSEDGLVQEIETLMSLRQQFRELLL